jgi:hypothetical protein
MTTEEKRHRLYVRLGDVLGDEEAATLMEHLPPAGFAWAELARRDEVATKADLERLRADMSVLGTELRADMNVLGTELRGEIKAQGGELRAEFHNAMRMQLFAILAAMAGQGALILAAAKAIH